MKLLEYLLANSGLAKTLNEDSPVTVEDLLTEYCDDPRIKSDDFRKVCLRRKLSYCIDLLEKLQIFAREKIKFSNCVIDGQLPYDSLVGLKQEDLSEIVKLIDYLDLSKELIRKIDQVIENGISVNKYLTVFDTDIENFDMTNTSDWATIGDLRGLKWCHEMGYELNEETIVFCVNYGHLDCLEYTYTHMESVSLTAGCCQRVAYDGHLDCLKWLHEHGCPWDEKTYIYAIFGDNFECFKYAHAPDGDRSRGCPLTSIVRTYAERYRRSQFIQYLIENNCPWNGVMYLDD